MLARRPQPPINPALRDREHHDFVPGFIVALIGFFMVVGGAWHTTGVDTTDGGTAWETQLVKAFAMGGLRFGASTPALPPPPNPEDPLGTAEALEKWAAQEAHSANRGWKVVVDTSAKTPCPT